MELEDIVNYTIIVALAVALVLMITGRFFDLTVERQSSVQIRSTINLLQGIVTDGPYLVTDHLGNNLKLMIDSRKYTGKIEIPRPKDFEGRIFNELVSCCDSIQYDYKFAIGDYKKTGRDILDANEVKLVVGPSLGSVKSNYLVVGEALELSDQCYTSFGLGNKLASSVPVSICDGDLTYCNPGVAYIETAHTPLAEISYWITQACESKYDLSKRIPLAEKDYVDETYLKVDNVNKEICLKDNCRRFYCDKEIKTGADDSLTGEIPWIFPPKMCNFAKITTKGGEMTITATKGVSS